MTNNSTFKARYKWSFSIWWIYKAFSLTLIQLLSPAIKSIRLLKGFGLELATTQCLVIPIITFFLLHSKTQYKVLTDIIVYDNLKNIFRFSFVYALLSVLTANRLFIITKMNAWAPMLSLTSLFFVANWFEREIWEFFGIFFFFHFDLRRLLTDYGFSGYALRKDFPLTGFLEVSYNDDQQRIEYKALELLQEPRTFNFKTNWVYS